ncbi:MAG: SDR family oxidoreductase [Planctomycetes bacterium]|nr:SDR family oxidoreductase [Planctomycetota bacterium]
MNDLPSSDGTASSADEEREPRSIWVVGASRGIGATLADALDEDNAVVRVSRSNGHDFTDEDSVRSMLDGRGVPLAWVHTPGDFFEKPLLETTDLDWSHLIESNLMSFVRASRAILPAMASRGVGSVVVFGVAGVSSGIAKTRGPAYFAVKSALVESMRTLALEYASRGVRINMVSPGAIVHAHSHRESQERVARRVPAGRLGQPGDLVGLVRFLVSDDSSYVTGQEISVDGGLAIANAPL